MSCRVEKVELRVLGGDKPEKYQLDGDVVGECSRFTAEVQPGALTVASRGRSAAETLPQGGGGFDGAVHRLSAA